MNSFCGAKVVCKDPRGTLGYLSRIKLYTIVGLSESGGHLYIHLDDTWADAGPGWYASRFRLAYEMG